MLVVTYRDDELGADHPLRGVLGALPQGLVHRMRPEPLSEAAVAELARRAGRPAAGLREMTGGNPLLVTEVLAAGEAGVPMTIRDLVLARLAGLPAAAQQVVRLVSVVPTRAELWLLEEALGPEPTAVERCVAAGLLVVGEDAVGFRHELLRRAVEGLLSALARRELNRRVLRVLSDAQGWGVDVARLVHHARQAGDAEAVLRYAPEAARQAATVAAHREAVGHYRAALPYADRRPPPVRAELLEDYSVQAYLSGLSAEAVSARQAALGLREAAGDREKVGEGLRWLSRLHWWAGSRQEAEAAAARAIAVLETLEPSHQLAMAYSNQAQLDMLAYRTEAALAWGSRAIELARRLDDPETLTHALTNIGTARRISGNLGGRVELEQAFEVAIAAGLEEDAARALVNLASGGMEFRDYRHARGDVDRAFAFTVQHDLAGYTMHLTGIRARLRLDQGDWAGAEQDARAALAELEPRRQGAPTRWTRWWSWVGCRHAAATRPLAARWRRPRRVRCPPGSCSGSGRWPRRGPSTPGCRVRWTVPRPRPPPGSSWRCGPATPGMPGNWPVGCGGPVRWWRRFRRWRPSRTGCCWPGSGVRRPAPGTRWAARMSRPRRWPTATSRRAWRRWGCWTAWAPARRPSFCAASFGRGAFCASREAPGRQPPQTRPG